MKVRSDFVSNSSTTAFSTSIELLNVAMLSELSKTFDVMLRKGVAYVICPPREEAMLKIICEDLGINPSLLHATSVEF